MAHSGADLQNGPDALRLEFGTSTLDILGYGAPLPPGFFETAPAGDVIAGHSLSRDPSHTDTDNNSADFFDLSAPTPRAP